MRVLYALQKFVVCVMLLCSVCGAYAIVQVSEENYSTYGFTADNYEQYLGYYAITNKNDLYAFVTFVNQNHPSANAVLTADIVVNQNVLDANGDVVEDVSSFVSWTPINSYSGTFDGQHHAIKGLYYKSTNSDSRCALVITSNDATIKNVGLVDSYFEANEACAFVYSSGYDLGYYYNYTILGCYNESTFAGTTVCGIAIYNGGTTSVIRDCYNTGRLLGGSYAIAYGGWGGSMLTIENCYNTYFYIQSGDWDDYDYYYPAICSGYLWSEEGTIITKNNYNSFPNTDCDAIYIDLDKVANGGLCARLNINEVWYQTLGVDAHPVLDPSHGTVYTSLPCMAQISNTPIDAHVYHVYADGYCTICGDEDRPTIVSKRNCHSLGLTEDFVGYYAIATSNQLSWFASWSYYQENGVLIADIIVNDHVLDEGGNLLNNGAGLKCWYNYGSYSGTFDGNGHYISGLYAQDNNFPVGLFSILAGGVVQNLGIKDSYFSGKGNAQKYSVGSICGLLEENNKNHTYGSIYNCYSEATVTGSGSYVGGISGSGKYGSMKVSNCYFKGKSSYAGINGNSATISNCYTIGSSSVAIGGYKRTNCYALSGCASTTDATVVTMEQVSSGELCYLLNGSIQGGEPWKQTLGLDAHPMLDKSHESVYMSGPCLPHDFSNNYMEIAHTFHDGICIVCGAYEEPALVTDENYTLLSLDAKYVGYYAIGNTGQLYSFAAGTYPQGVLSNDIYVNRNVLSETGGLKANVSALRVWDLYEFNRLLDGNGYSINGLYYSDYATNGVGLFSSVTGTISNVGIADSYFGGNKNVGALSGSGGTITNCWSSASIIGIENVGGISGSSATITNSYNTGFVTGSSAYTGGVCGYEGTLTNCYNIGRVSGKNYVGGLNGANATIIDSYNYGQVSGTATYVGAIAGAAQATNCYYLENSATDGSATVQTGIGFSELGLYSSESPLYIQPRTAAQFASGDVCFRLNGMEQGSSKWYQAIGTDNYPVLSASHGVVYASSPCPAEYGNEVQGTHNHEFGTNGVCSVCGEYNSEMMLQQVTAENYSSLGLNEEHIGYYCITTVDELYWFAHYVNTGHNTINAVLLNNLTVNDLTFDSEQNLTSDIASLRVWMAIGKESTPYQGTFDGQNHTIGGLYHNSSVNNVGLFGYVIGTITNIGVINSYFHANNNVGSIAGYAQTITNSYSNSIINGNSYVGGVAGSVETVTNSYNIGFVSGNENVGGVVGSSVMITFCYNNGTINGATSVGGIVGNVNTISNCHNRGHVTSVQSIVGGVAGKLLIAEKCYNIGIISGGANLVGSIAGSGSANIANCIYLENSAVDGASQTQYGIGATTIGSYNPDVAGKTISKSQDEFASGEVCFLLNGSEQGGNLWYQTLQEDPYPTFDSNHGKVYKTAPCLSYSNTTTEKEHHYEDGVCVCGDILTPTLITNENYASYWLTNDYVGYYALENVGHLYAFSAMVNAGSTNINGILLSDLVVNQNVVSETNTLNSGSFKSWTPIGTSTNKFSGVFDGYNHIIRGLYVNSTSLSFAGLFGVVAGGTIKNIEVQDSYMSARQYVGGICGQSTGAYIQNCSYSGVVSGSNSNVGGICGFSQSTTFTNCYNTASVSSSSVNVGGICGCSQGSTLQKCYNIGSVNGQQSYVGAIVGYRTTGTIENCFYLKNCASDGSSVSQSGIGVETQGEVAVDEEGATILKTYADFSSGALCYVLNDEVQAGSTWYQTIGEDASPVLNPTHGKVYKTTPCIAYSNTGSEKEHDFGEIGICVCGMFIEPELVTLDNYKTLGVAAKYIGYYAIATQGNLYALAAMVNAGNTSVNAILISDIVVNNNVLNADGNLNNTMCREWTPIGTSTNAFAGNFEGNAHTISGLYYNESANNNVGLFGNVTGTIENLGIKDSYFYGNQNVGGISGYGGSIQNCYSTATVKGTSNVAGLCGNSGTITNCYFAGVENAVSSKYIYNSEGEKQVVTQDKFSNGTICYILNDSQSENVLWYQTIGTDAYPTLSSNSGVVYLSSPCPVYSNDMDLVSQHTYNAQGYCNVCSEGQAATLVTNENYEALHLSADYVGYYAISNEAQLFWLAAEVNEGHTVYNAVLVADVMVEKPWTPIGNASKSYSGIFDGNSYTITGLTYNNTVASAKYVGLFGYTIGQAIIKNLGVCNVNFSAYQYVGGIVGCASSNTSIINCYTTGSVSANYSTSYVGGIAGSGSALQNCYSTASISGSRSKGALIGSGGSAINSYYVSGGSYTNTTIGSTAVSANMFSSGEVCYLLNEEVSGGSIWYQTIGTDSYPILDATHKKVYQVGPCKPISYANIERIQPHTSENGVCSVCGLMEDVTLVTEENHQHLHLGEEFVGYFAIENMGQLYSFANRVNKGQRTIKGVLVNDIHVNDNVLNANGNLQTDVSSFRTWTPIGSATYQYNGTFEGNNYDIEGLYCNSASVDNIGLFGRLDANASISNVTISDSYFYGRNSVGAIAGYNGGTITNCMNESTVIGTSSVGGIVGSNGTVAFCANTGKVNASSSNAGGIVGNGGVISNSYNTGSVNGTSYVGGVSGNGSVISNSYNVGTVRGNSNYVGAIAGDATTVVNNYYLANSAKDGSAISQKGLGCQTRGSVTEDKKLQSEEKTSAQFTSGEVCYLLNRSVSGGTPWYQTIDSDMHPVLDMSHEKIYATEPCASQFANSELEHHEHTIGENGMCTACGAYQNATLVTAENYESLGLSTDFVGYYAIENRGQLYWFSEQVYKGSTSINGVLLADIVDNAEVLDENGELLSGKAFNAWLPIGNSTNAYKGTFDGNNHSVSGLYFNNGNESAIGLFGYLLDAEIKNVGVKDTYFKAQSSVGGICGYEGSNSVIDNCYSEASLVGSNVGGICGDIDFDSEAKISNSYNKGYISGLGALGGIVGFSCIAEVTNCYNEGSIEALQEGKVGGIIGESSGGVVEQCYNTGALSGKYVGGICGKTGGIIKNCYNEGNITNDGYYAGGIVGTGSATIQYCYNQGTINVTTGDRVGGIIGDGGQSIQSCYNIGIIKSTAANSFVGAIAGNSNGTIQYCYYISGCASNSNGVRSGCGNVVDAERKLESMILGQFMNGEVCYKLNGYSNENPVWYQSINADNYPVWDETHKVVFFDDIDAFYYNNLLITIEENEQGTIVLNPETSVTGEVVTIEVAPNEGYSFVKWSNGATQNPLSITMLYDTTLSVVYTPRTYSIAYELNGGRIHDTEYATKYTYTQGAVLPENITNEGYSFAGWYEAPNYSSARLSAIDETVLGDKIFYAKWIAETYDVTYNTNEGELSNAVTSYTYGYGLTLTSDVSRNGYTFAGWYDNEDCTGNRVYSISITDFGNKEYWAKWNVKSYAINYVVNEGTLSGEYATTYEYGTKTPLPQTIAREGYEFLGWYVNSNYDGSAIDTVSSLDFGDKTYYAKWIAKMFSVTLNANDGDINSGNVSYYTYGNLTILPVDVTKIGHTFDGWYDNEGCTGEAVISISATETGNKTFYAKWTPRTYSVTLQTNNGTIKTGNITSYTFGNGATLPTDIIKEGYEFLGWFDNSSYDGGAVTIIADNEIGNKNYWAKWKATMYNVTLDVDGGTINANAIDKYAYGVGAILPTDVTKIGYRFKGWKDAENNSVLEISTADYGDKTFTAQWEQADYSITYNANGGTINETYVSTYVYDGEEITLPTDVTREGKTFAGWYDNANLTGEAVSVIPKSAYGDKTFYADWTANQYAVEFETYGGIITSGEIATYTYGVVASLPTNVVKSGYTFTGWYSDEECTSAVVSIISSTTSGKQKFYAGWSNAAYSVTLNTNDGVILEGNVTSYIYGDSVKLPSANQITKPGYTFGGWYDNSSCNGTAQTEIGKNVTGNLFFWAKWTVNSYTVSLHTDGGIINSGNVTAYVYGNGAILPSDVTKVGYTFAGWYDNEECTGTRQTGIDEFATDDKEFWAKWEVNSYDIVLNVNEGTINAGNVETYTFGVGAALPTDVTRPGHTFAGWYTNDSYLGSVVTAIPLNSVGDKTYYAKWDVNIYTVSLIANGGTINSGNLRNYTYGVGATLPTDMTKIGYTFNGWYDNDEFAGEAVTAIANNVTGEKTFYAKWTINTYAVTLNANGGEIDGSIVSSYEYGMGAQLPEAVTKTGYTFAGWYDNANLTGESITAIANNVTGNKTFYAKWNVNSYKVTLTENGGTINSGNVVAYIYSNGAILPVDVTKIGNKFDGWYESEDFSSDVVLSIPLDAYGDKTYYAKWTANSYDIVLNVLQGTINEEYATSYTFGSAVKLPTDVSREGYTFAGWYTNSNYDGSEFAEISSNDFGNKTFYAKWIRKSYSVSVEYSKVMGFVDGIDIYNHGDVAKLRAKADAGFEFVSWSCDDEDILKDVSPYDSTLVITVVKPVSLMATFKMKESIYTVGELRIDTVKTDTEIMPIELSTLFQSSENGEIFYVATSTSPNVILPQIEDGKLFLATFGVQGKATITVVGKLANGARATLSCETVVEYNCNIQVSAEITNTSCFGTKDGGISLSAEHEYTYKWMNLDNTTMKVEGLAAGNYSVEISDERGCKEIETYIVMQPDEIVAEIDTVVPFSCDKASEIRLKVAGEYTYLWSDGSTTKDLIGAEVGDYTVTVTNPTTNCSVQLAQSIELPFKKPEISLVTVSKETGKNLIVWVRENTDKIDYYTIYRETTVGGEFKAIGTVKYTEISVFEDDDPQVDPQNRSWSYKISATDFCGNETELSDMHSTIHLSQPDSHREGYVDLSWNPYVGVDYSSYIIICETTIDSYTFVDTVTTLPSSLESYSAVVPPIGKSVFYIGIKLGQVIDPKGFLKAESGPFALAISNIAEVENSDIPDAIDDLTSKVDVFTIGKTIYVKNAKGAETVIYDIKGQKIFANEDLDEYTFSIKLDGVYIVKVGNEIFKVVVK